MQKELVGFSWIRIIRDYTPSNPVQLSNFEKESMERDIAIFKQYPFALSAQEHYVHYKKLYCKSVGNESMSTLSTLCKTFLGEKYSELYSLFTRLIPTEPEGDQYAAWDRPAITTSSSMGLFAYFIDVILTYYDKINLLQDYDVEQLAAYAHMHVLPPADIMMARAGCDHRGIDVQRVQLMFEDILYNVFKVQGVERVILNDKTVCLLSTKYLNRENAWKLFATLEKELSEQLLKVIITDELLEKTYSLSRIIYNYSKSKDALFGGTPGEVYVAFAPFRKMSPSHCLQRFGIDVMEEALEKTYSKIKDHEDKNSD